MRRSLPLLRSFLPGRPSPLLRPPFRPQPRHHNFQQRFSSSTRPNPDPTPHLTSPPSQTLSQRLRTLSREYGWSAVGVYFLLSAADFPFCFLAVRALGPERVGAAEAVVVGWVKSGIRMVAPGLVGDGSGEKQEAVEREGGDGWGVESAQRANAGENASIWTELALAYAIHKSFIFIRVPLTAAVTPKVVKTLRGWGWDIGKRKPKQTVPAGRK